MFRRYPPMAQRIQNIIDLLHAHPYGLRQAEIARLLNYPAKMVMDDLRKIEYKICLDEGKIVLVECAEVANY